jgi:putative two-component system response regulator
MQSHLVDLHEQLRRLNRIGIALSSEQNLSKLLNLILQEARNFTSADAGSLYIRKGDGLVFITAQNDTLSKRNSQTMPEKDYTGLVIPLSQESIAGFVASTGQTLNIPDVYHLPQEAEYKFFRKFDEENQYRTQSVLAVPLKDPEGEIIGVLQLINALNEKNEVVPFDERIEDLVHSLASQAAVAIKNAQLLEELKQAHLDTILRLSRAAEYRDEDTDAHLRRVSSYAVVVAKKLKLPEEDIELLKYASPMHDIGKLGVPDAVLLKPGKLTEEEFAEMKKHTIIGAKILDGSDLKLFKIAKEIALSHHEKFDGSGYPYGLKGEEIPLMGRIVALPDVFDALTSKRVYKPAYSVEKTLEIIKSERGKHFDPMVVDAFLDSLDAILEIFKVEQG